MANFGEKNTNNSQFFITTAAMPNLGLSNVVVYFLFFIFVLCL